MIPPSVTHPAGAGSGRYRTWHTTDRGTE